MEGFVGTISPPGMYVRALYDYEAEDSDSTSLSFRAGDIIQVLTQLESGWWDGVIRHDRGWFPSNYCELVPAPEARRLDQGLALEKESDGAEYTETESEDDYDGLDNDSGYQEELREIPDAQSSQFVRQNIPVDQDESVFWIPRATQNGNLYYYNTLTGASRKDLPLESPSTNHGANAALSNDQFSATSHEGTHPQGLDDSANRPQSYISDGASPSTSMESLSMDPGARSRAGPRGNNSGSLDTGSRKALSPDTIRDPEPVKLTWDQLTMDMRDSVERYRQAIHSNKRSDFVRRAEDISDHLRLILAAGSGTTDNHSGNPSVISTNKTLYPRFRDMMSRFSKLVLNSHIAAADYPSQDYRAKCIQDAEGVLDGVYGFVEIARQQRGEEIPRLFPGFIPGAYRGGNWRNNALTKQQPLSALVSIPINEIAQFPEPNTVLDVKVAEHMRDLQRVIISGIRRLEQKLAVQDKLISRQRHRAITRDICQASEQLLDAYRPWMSTLESLNLSALTSQSQSPSVLEYADQKQKIYNLTADLVVACQAVGAPLADEWAADRGQSMEERINHVQSIVKDFEVMISRMNHTLQMLVEAMANAYTRRSLSGGGEAESVFSHQTNPSTSSKGTSRSILGDISQQAVSPPSSSGETPGTGSNLLMHAENPKVRKYFGQVPVEPSSPEADNQPHFMRLEHEGEVRYDKEKSLPSKPVIKGGTLAGLVEQLTRHDTYNSDYNIAFLLSYQSFTTAAELFQMLVQRWSIQPPPGLTKEEYEMWQLQKQQPVRIRVVNILRTWIDWYWMEPNDENSASLMNKLHAFATDTVSPTGTGGHQQLVAVIEQRMRGEHVGAKGGMKPRITEAPQPILPKNMRKFKSGDIDPTEFARQLTIIDQKLYLKIRPQECLSRLWSKKDLPQESDPAINIKALINHSNHLTNWVADMIVSVTEVKKRAAVIKHFVAVADRCRSIHNYSALTAILAAFGSSPIHRLNRTWASVDKKTNKVVEELRTLMSSVKNFATYRAELIEAAPYPTIPFLGVYLTDLTFIDEANASMIKKTDLINFAKRIKLAEVINQIGQFQKQPYNFKSIPELQNYILDKMQQAPDVSEIEMYNRSLEIEPREREDEKIARLLSESGFL